MKETFHTFPRKNLDFYQPGVILPTQTMGNSSNLPPTCVLYDTSKMGNLILVVVEPTHLKNMRKSTWVHLPQFSVKNRINKKIFETPPLPSSNDPCLTQQKTQKKIRQDALGLQRSICRLLCATAHS